MCLCLPRKQWVDKNTGKKHFLRWWPTVNSQKSSPTFGESKNHDMISFRDLDHVNVFRWPIKWLGPGCTNRFLATKGTPNPRVLPGVLNCLKLRKVTAKPFFQGCNIWLPRAGLVVLISVYIDTVRYTVRTWTFWKLRIVPKSAKFGTALNLQPPPTLAIRAGLSSNSQPWTAAVVTGFIPFFGSLEHIWGKCFKNTTSMILRDFFRLLTQLRKKLVSWWTSKWWKTYMWFVS